MKRIVVLLVLTLMLAGCTTLDSAAPPKDSSGSRTEGAAKTTAGPETNASGGETEQRTEGRKVASGAGLHTVTIEASSGESVKVRVEIADDIFERARGLMYREKLGERRGMLFVYGEEDTRSFYMKNTTIPLSIAFMDAEGRIVDIQDLKPLDETSRRSAKPAQYALEVNQGFFEERGIEVGDRVELPV